MIFVISVACLLLAVSCSYKSAAVAPGKDPAGLTLNDRVKMLNELTAKRSYVKLNTEKFKNLVRGSPRNYSTIVMFTALSSSRGCQICREVLEEYQIVANSWRFSNTYINSELYFTVVDFDEGAEAFQLMGLNSAPVIMHFPAKGKRREDDTFEIQRLGFSAEIMSKWILDRTGIHVRVFRPPNYSGTIAMSLLFIIVAGILFMKRNNLEFLYNTKVWGVVALCIIFAMTSGQMWNHMRGPPFAHRNPQTGQINYIHGSSQGQFIAESHFVLILNGLITFGFILLTNAANPSQDPQEKKPGEKPSSLGGDIGKRRVMVIAGLMIITIFFSVLLSIFRSKYQGYPYTFLLR
jgi:oligosaccharyltransferase complex subunit gamma